MVLLQPHAGADVRGGSASDPTPATTTANSTDTTNPAKPTVRSESVAATLFGLGALRFLCGIFFTRLAQLTLPGGAGIELLPPATQAKVLKKAAAIAKERDADSPAPSTSRCSTACVTSSARRRRSARPRMTT